MSSNWKEILRAQEEDLQRMEEMDAALNDDQNDLDQHISSIMKSTSSKIRQPKHDVHVRDDEYSRYVKSSHDISSDRNAKLDMGGIANLGGDDPSDDDTNIATSRSESMLSPSGKSLASPSRQMTKQAPDTTAR